MLEHAGGYHVFCRTGAFDEQAERGDVRAPVPYPAERVAKKRSTIFSRRPGARGAGGASIAGGCPALIAWLKNRVVRESVVGISLGAWLSGLLACEMRALTVRC